MTSFGSRGSNVNINKLGLRIDGWADLIEGGAEKASDARTSLETRVNAREWPQTQHDTFQVSPTTGSKQRTFTLIEMANGATIAAYIDRFGNDLFAKWDLYVRPLWNTWILQRAGAIVAVFALIAGIDRRFGGDFTFSFSKFLIYLVGWAIFALVALAIAGTALHRNPLHFFFKQLDEFDIDDIAALSLAAHQSILSALDEVGFSIETLRVKEQFRPGTRERVI